MFISLWRYYNSKASCQGWRILWIWWLQCKPDHSSPTRGLPFRILESGSWHFNLGHFSYMHSSMYIVLYPRCIYMYQLRKWNPYQGSNYSIMQAYMFVKWWESVPALLGVLFPGPIVPDLTLNLTEGISLWMCCMFWPGQRENILWTLETVRFDQRLVASTFN